MHSIGLIGVGGIAGCFSAPGDPFGYNHLAGIHLARRLKLAGLADTSEERLAQFRKNWGAAFPDAKCYPSAETMLKDQEFDIVDVCVRGSAHFPVAMEVLRAGTQMVFLEKAPTASLDEMDRMTDAARARGVPIVVSYSRHWSPISMWLEQFLRKGNLGPVRTVIGYCGGPVLSMGSHQTDMICQFAGYEAKSVRAFGSIPPVENLPAGYEPEPNPDSMAIEFSGGVTGLQVGSRSIRGGLCCDVFCSEGLLQMAYDNGPPSPQRVARAVDGKKKEIDLPSLGMPKADNVFKVAFEQMADHLEGGPLPACANEKWVAVHEIGCAAVESIVTGTRVDLPCVNRSRRIAIM